jgi:hypothetical protein
MGLTLVVADGVTLTANTVGNHYMSVGTAVTLSGTTYSIFDLDGTYTVTSIPTANSFTCSTTLAGISYNGTMSFVGIACGDIISYFSTRNSNLWVNNLTNKTWQITAGSIVGTTGIFTTSAPSNFPVGSSVILNLPLSGLVNETVIVSASTDTTFTATLNSLGDGYISVKAGSFYQAYSSNSVPSSWNKVTQPLVRNFRNIAFGNGVFVAVGDNLQAYSYNGRTWNVVASPLAGTWKAVGFGNGVFVAVGSNIQARSVDNGLSWTSVASPIATGFIILSVAYGNGVFVTSDSSNQYRSINYGVSWVQATTSASSYGWYVGFGNGNFVMVGNTYGYAYSIDNGDNWTRIIPSPDPTIPSSTGIAFGNGVFITASQGGVVYSSTNGLSWSSISAVSGAAGITYINGVFIILAGQTTFYSTNNGISWTAVTDSFVGSYSYITSGVSSYANSPSDSVSLVVLPLQLTNRVFSSNVYPSISFANASDAAFWGFDARNGLSYSLTATPPWTLTQSGWVSGFLPPSTSTWDDSVAHKLVRDARILVGKQTIKEYTGAYIELQNDLTVPYENKAILKLLNGTLDQTQATAAREYYTTLPLGTKEIPLCALTRQQMSVEVDFEAFTNLSQNLNPGTGDFLNPQSYTTYNASTGILNGQPVNVQTTFSYQQYIFIVTYAGQFIVYDTTKDVADPTSYIVLSAFSGTSLFSQFCVLSGTLYIGLSDGTLASINISELIQGNISSFATNNYAPTIGTLTGTVVADFRYVYYTLSNTATSNIFMTQYDTTGSFMSTGSYKSVNFTKTFNSNVTGVYQTLSTGTQLIMLPNGTPGFLYTYQLNANVQSQWYLLDYSAYGNQITAGTLIGNDLYFITESVNILKYSNSTFTVFTYLNSLFVSGYTTAYSVSKFYFWKQAINTAFNRDIAYNNGVFVGVGQNNQYYSIDNGKSWITVANPVSGTSRKITVGNGIFIAINTNGLIIRSADNGVSWTAITNPFTVLPFYQTGGIGYGNGVFIAVLASAIARSTDYGLSWTLVTSPTSQELNVVGYGNGVFVVGGIDVILRSTDYGLSWSVISVPALTPFTGYGIVYADGVFIMNGASFGKTFRSTDYGLTWQLAPIGMRQYKDIIFIDNVVYTVNYSGSYYAKSNDKGLTWTEGFEYYLGYGGLAGVPQKIQGDSLRNLNAVGNYIYASTSNAVVQIDTTQDLSTSAAYKFPAPVLPDGQYVFTNGPRYVYMFSQSDPAAQNIVRFDPYPPVPLLKTSLLVDYESLPEGTKKPDKALIGLVQTQKILDMTNMDVHGPVKELWVTGPSAASNVFQYSNLATRSTLELAGERIVTDDDGTHTFLNIIEPFETHTSMPLRNVSIVSFEFDPESAVPNGTINFSRIRDQVFEGDAETVWARNYNLLAIQGGTGGLIFNS